MSSNNDFSTASPQKQAEIIHKFMQLFRGSERGHGYGEAWGVKRSTEKNKWEYDRITRRNGKLACAWEHSKPSENDFAAHLNGFRALGIGPILDDGTTWRGEIDVDKIGETKYEFDYHDEMQNIKSSGLPFVVNRTKSTGLRLIMFFSEPIEAELVRHKMEAASAKLGYAGNEIFPKQTVLAKKDDCPSWTFLPYGPTFGTDKFAEQCGMSESGNAMTLEEYISFAEKSTISREQLMQLDMVEQKARANGKANGKHKQKGLWSLDKSYNDTIVTTFWDGPPCMFEIVQHKCRDMQHNFLFDVGLFFKRKYPDNWPEALRWVNENILVPRGNDERFVELVKDLKKKDYQYRCKDEPICSHCNPYACRRMPYGVGTGPGGEDHYELGMTIIKRGADTIFLVNVGTERIPFNAAELKNVETYREKCLAYAVVFPPSMKKPEWDRVVNNSIENAPIIEPPTILQKNASEVEMLARFFDARIPIQARALGQAFLDGKNGDNAIRVRDDEQRIYFKWGFFLLFCQRTFNLGDRQAEKLRMFLADKGLEHDRTYSKGGFYRSSISIPYEIFDPLVVEHWLHPDREEKDVD